MIYFSHNYMYVGYEPGVWVTELCGLPFRYLTHALVSSGLHEG